jgi:hypothetical protein
MNPLLMAMMQAMQAQQQQPQQRPAPRGHALARAMLGRTGREGQKNLSLAALKPYGESDFADRLGGGPNAPIPAFQTDAFANDAFQVEGVE